MGAAMYLLLVEKLAPACPYDIEGQDVDPQEHVEINVSAGEQDVKV